MEELQAGVQRYIRRQKMADNKSPEPEDVQVDEILEEDAEDVAGGLPPDNCMLSTVGSLI
jgi:hypothetical protein